MALKTGIRNGSRGDICARPVEHDVVQIALHILSYENAGMFAGVDVSFE